MTKETLTDQEKQRLDEIAEEWRAIALGTEPMDWDKAVAAVPALYQAADLKPPTKVVRATSLLDGVVKAARHHFKLGRKQPNQSQKDEILRNHTVFGQGEAGWLAFYDAMRQLNVDPCSELEGLWAMAKYAGPFHPFEDRIIIAERPCAIHIDDRHNLHHDTEHAIAWPDGFGIYVWHGLPFPKRHNNIFKAPETVTRNQILKEGNQEIRTACIEALGWDRVIEILGAERIQADDYGTLYRVKDADPDDGDIMLVQVTNSTPEPSGEHRKYFLRVPPTTEAARQAVAWTFNVSRPEDYELIAET